MQITVGGRMGKPPTYKTVDPARFSKMRLGKPKSTLKDKLKDKLRSLASE